MTGTNDKLRGLFLAALMVFSVFAGTVALSGTAAAAANDVSLDQGDQEIDLTETDSQTQELTVTVDGTEDSITVDYGEFTDAGASLDSDVSVGGAAFDEVNERNDNSIEVATDGSGDVTLEFEWNFEDAENSNRVRYQVMDSEGNNLDVPVRLLGDHSEEIVDEDANYEYDVFTGETLRLTADSTDTQIRIYENDDGDFGTRVANLNTGDYGQSITFDSSSLGDGDYLVRFGDESSPNGEPHAEQLVLNDLGLETELEDTDILDTDDIQGELSSSAPNDDYTLTLYQVVDDDDDEVVQDADGNDVVIEDSFDGLGESDFTIDAIADLGDDYTYEDDYYVQLEHDDSGVSVDSDTIEVTEDTLPDAGEASFGDRTVVENRGDVAEITINLDDSEEDAPVAFQLGTDEVGYNTTLELVDDGDGEINLLFNTYTAGSAGDGDWENVFSTASDDDEIISWTGESGSFPQTDAEQDTLDATEYDMQVSTDDDILDDDDLSFAAGDEEDVGALSLSDSSIDGMENWRAPADTDIEEVSDIEDASQANQITGGEIIVHEVSATGLEGLLESEVDGDLEDSGDATDALHTGAIDERLNFDLEQTEAPPNADASSMALGDFDDTSLTLVADPANDTYYFVVDSEAIDGEGDPEIDFEEAVDDGLASYETTFEVPELDEGTGDSLELGDASAEWNYESISLDVQTNDQDEIILRNEADQVIRGSSNLAPGTELTVRATSQDSTSPFVVPMETDVDDDGSFSVSTGEFEDEAAGTNFTVQVRRSGDGLGTWDGQLRAPATADLTFEDQSVAEENQVVTVNSADLSDGGFIAIHEGDADGDIVGTTSKLGAGDSPFTDVNIALDDDVENGTTLVATAYQDEDANNAFDADTDGAYTDNGSAVTAEAEVTVETDPANFDVSDISPSAESITAGDSLDVSATVENTGGSSGEQTVELVIGGDTLDSQDVELDAGDSETVSFDGVDTSDLEPGTYTHSIASEDDESSGALTVEEDVTPTPTTEPPTTEPPTTEPPTTEPPTTEPPTTEPPTEPPTTEPPTTEPMTTTDDPTPSPTTTDTGPGFGAIVALVSMLAAALLAGRRRA